MHSQVPTMYSNYRGLIKTTLLISLGMESGPSPAEPMGDHQGPSHQDQTGGLGDKRRQSRWLLMTVRPRRWKGKAFRGKPFVERSPWPP
jgi:hypothetical protein